MTQEQVNAYLRDRQELNLRVIYIVQRLNPNDAFYESEAHHVCIYDVDANGKVEISALNRYDEGITEIVPFNWLWLPIDELSGHIAVEMASMRRWIESFGIS